LVGIPGLVAALIVSALFLGMAAGTLWLFVYGDNTWPAWVESALPLSFAMVFMTVWLASLVAGYIMGKRMEQKPVFNKSHVVISAGITALSIAFIVFYQIGVGNIGPKSDETRCSEYCTQQGYSASSVSPRDAGTRTCGCLSSTGNEVITVPVSELGANK
jgi:hypothetical protein